MSAECPPNNLAAPFPGDEESETQVTCIVSASFPRRKGVNVVKKLAYRAATVMGLNKGKMGGRYHWFW
ncbi:hypothetical protein GCM10022224_004260 [Nonomuraea antimicrobica]|uniref:Uncharacterized protein n=1 Tax=Nonomuraea antimicrobica TaxID=561173 RepID=A0ABP7B011_9ACTN